MYVFKDQLDYLKKNLQKLYRFSCHKRSDPDPIQLFRKRIRIFKTATGFSPGINTQSHVLVKNWGSLRNEYPLPCFVLYLLRAHALWQVINKLLAVQKLVPLKVHKRENFLGSDIEICTFS